MPLTSEEDHAFRFLVKVVIESLPSLNERDLPFRSEERKEFPAVAAYDLGIVPVSVQENFVKALFFEIRVAALQWDQVWIPYYQEIAASGENYVNFVLFSCVRIHESSEPFYVKFLDIFGMVSAFAFRFLEQDYHVYTAPILMVFYERFLRVEFCEAGGWEGLDRHLGSLNYLRWYHLKGDVHRSDVRDQFLQETSWRGHGKCYNRRIRFVSAFESLNHAHCKAMAEQVLALDTSICDRFEDVDIERFVAAADSAQSESFQKDRRQKSVLLEEDRERLKPIEAEEAIVKMALLKNQKGYEVTMLQVVESLIKMIDYKLTEAFEVSTYLELLYKAAKESGGKKK